MRRKKQQSRNNRKKRKTVNFSGQHFLRCRHLAKQIVEMGRLSDHDLVLDLGAGSGRLTEHIAEQAGKVWAVEYDQKWVQRLKRKFADRLHVRVIAQDILQLGLPKKPFIVIANIPYGITTAILRKILQPQGRFLRGIFVLEKGAAMRFTANPVVHPEILKWRIWYRLERGKTLPAHFFVPAPKVDSAVFRVERREKPLIAPHLQNRFLALAKYGLKYPRAPIDLALKGIFTSQQIKHLLRNLCLERRTEICQLSEKHWSIVFHTMVQKVPAFRWPK